MNLREDKKVEKPNVSDEDIKSYYPIDIKLVRTITREHRVVKSTQSKKAKDVFALKKKYSIIDNTYMNLLIELGEIILGEKITDTYKFPLPGCMVVPLLAYGGHNYTIGVACLLISSGGEALKSNGAKGNCLLTGDLNNIRIATDEEIDSFYKNYPNISSLDL
jgi:hypothetical protein